MHGHGDPDSPFVLYELNDIREMCQFEARNKDVTYWELFKPDMINRTHIGVFTQIWSQLTGMNVMSRLQLRTVYKDTLTENSVLHHLCVCHGGL